jgi:hypothetical protein
MTIDKAFQQVKDELLQAQQNYPTFNTAHEGYAILLEEVEELWEEIKHRPRTRSISRMRAEAIQIAAMAIRFMVDVCKEEEEGIV